MPRAYETNMNNNNLTTGRLAKGLVNLAGPMFASALLQNVQSLIDLFWVGKLGSNSVAALALSGTILMMMLPIIMGTATGTVAFVSRCVGAGRHDDASEAAGQSLVLAVLFGVIAGIVGWFFAGNLCFLLGASADVARLGSGYLRILFLGSITVFVLFVGNSVLQGAGNTIVPMCAMVLANMLNMVLDPVLIFGLWIFPRMEVRGAAVATVLSQAVAAVAILVVLSWGVGRVRVRARGWRFKPALAWTILRVGIFSSGQMLSRSLMALVLMRIVAMCGTAAIAAYGIGLRFHMITLMPAFALGNAAATMVGQNLGAGKPGRAQSAAWMATGIEMGIMVLATLVVVLFAPVLIGIFDSNPDVIATGVSYLRTVSPFYIFAVLGIVLGRALQGAGDTLTPMICTVLSLWGLQVPLAIVLSLYIQPPTTGIWWAIAIAVTVHGLMVTGYFQSGRWKAKTL